MTTIIKLEYEPMTKFTRSTAQALSRAIDYLQYMKRAKAATPKEFHICTNTSDELRRLYPGCILTYFGVRLRSVDGTL